MWTKDIIDNQVRQILLYNLVIIYSTLALRKCAYITDISQMYIYTYKKNSILRLHRRSTLHIDCRFRCSGAIWAEVTLINAAPTRVRSNISRAARFIYADITLSWTKRHVGRDALDDIKTRGKKNIRHHRSPRLKTKTFDVIKTLRTFKAVELLPANYHSRRHYVSDRRAIRTQWYIRYLLPSSD